MRRLLCLLATLVVVPAAPAAAIVGGSGAGEGEYPWQVWLSIGCGGTVVAPNTILTAAHCTSGRLPSEITVRFGGINRALAPSRAVLDIANHPARVVRDDLEPRFDMARLDLASPLPTSAQPLTLVASEEEQLWETGKSLRASGWGETDDDASPNVLHWVDVPRVADDVCEDAYDAFDASNMLCAGATGRDTCQGDSGGPLAAPATPSPDPRQATHWRLVGVTSFGTGCGLARFPGVYANVHALRDFASPSRTVVRQPRPVGAPVLEGAPQVGVTLTCRGGGWANDPERIEQRVFRLATLGDSRQLVATSGVYTLVSHDVGRRFVCAEIAENVGGSATASSGPTAAVAPSEAPAPAAPAPVTEPQPLTPPPTAVPVTADTSPPIVRSAGRVCRRRRCTFAVLVRDVSGVRRITARVGGRRLRVRRLSSTMFELRSGRLPRGRLRLIVEVVDRAGNRRRWTLRFTATGGRR